MANFIVYRNGKIGFPSKVQHSSNLVHFVNNFPFRFFTEFGFFYPLTGNSPNPEDLIRDNAKSANAINNEFEASYLYINVHGAMNQIDFIKKINEEQFKTTMHGLPQGDKLSYVLCSDETIDKHSIMGALAAFKNEQKFQADLNKMFVGQVCDIEWFTMSEMKAILNLVAAKAIKAEKSKETNGKKEKK